MPFHTAHPIFRHLLCIALLWPLLGESRAQTWTSNSGGVWSAAANWGNTLPTNDGTANVVFLKNGVVNLNDTVFLDQSWDVHAVTLNPNALAFDGSGFMLANPSSGPAPTLALESALTDATGGGVTVQPNLRLGAAVTVSTTNSLTLSGSVTGPGSLIKTGAGTLFLSGTGSSYTGGTVIAAGVLQTSSAGSLGSGPIDLKGATLDLRAPQSTLLFPQPFQVESTGGTIKLDYTEAHLNGAIIGAGALTLDTAGSGTAKSTGRFTLGATNGYSGGTIINAVTVNAQASHSLGTGPITLNNTYAVLSLGPASLAAGQQVTMKPASVLVLTDPALDPAAIINPNAAQTTGGAWSIAYATRSAPVNEAAIGNGKMFFGSSAANAQYTATSFGAGSDGIYRLGGGSLQQTSSPSLTFTGPANLLTGARSLLVGNGSNVPPGDFNAGGTFTLMQANNYTGGTTLNSGTLVIGTDATLGTGPITFSTGTLASAGGTRQLANPIFINSFGTLSGDFQLNGPIDLGGQSVSLRAGGTETLTGAVSHGSLTLTGIWHLNGANTASALDLDSGSYYFSGDGNLGAAGAPVTLYGATLIPSVSATFTHPFTMSGYTPTVNTNGHTVTFSGQVSGAANFTKVGAGTLLLTGDATGLSTMFVTAGTLTIQGGKPPQYIYDTGATLAGTGLLPNSNLSLGAHLSPGDTGLGTMTFPGVLNCFDGTTIDFDLGKTGADKVLFINSGYLLFSGTLDIHIRDAGGLAPGQTYTLLDWSGGAAPNYSTGANFQLAGSPIGGTLSLVGSKLEFITIPEPATGALLLATALLLARRPRRPVRSSPGKA